MAIAGPVAQGVGASRQAAYEGSVARLNASQSVDKSRDAIARGQDELKIYQGKAGQTMGDQRAAFAANGIEVGYGSAVDVQADAQANSLADQKTITSNYTRERQGFLIDASNYMGESAAAKSRQRGAVISTALNVAGTALGAASQVGKINAAKKG